MIPEDQIRRLVFTLREAFEAGDDAAVEETIEKLEAVVAAFKGEQPGD